MGIVKAVAFSEQFGVDAKAYGWLGVAQDIAARADLTKRECTIVQHMISYHSDRSTLKSKLEQEVRKATEASVYDKISPCLRALMSRAESGRDLGPAE